MEGVVVVRQGLNWGVLQAGRDVRGENMPVGRDTWQGLHDGGRQEHSNPTEMWRIRSTREPNQSQPTIQSHLVPRVGERQCLLFFIREEK